jgi:hypothetical protein
MDLERQIKIKDAYLQLIKTLAADGDGDIDEIGYYAQLAINNNDKEAIYTKWNLDDKNIELNILMEEIENE